MGKTQSKPLAERHGNGMVCVNPQEKLDASIYRVIFKSVKHFKNLQQIDYATDHANFYADRERNSPSFF
jgi:hypothetical protein